MAEMNMCTRLNRYFMGLVLVLGTMTAVADDVPEFTIVIKDHVFLPSELVIPAGVKVKLLVDNQDPTPEEFESHELNREKVVPAKSKVKIFVGPLSAGAYPFFGDFNPQSAKGKILVK